MKQFAFIIFCFLSLNINGQEDKFYHCKWFNENTLSTSISQEKYSFNSKSRLNYCISNNNDFLAIDIKIDDSEAKIRILTEGLILWINMDGRSNRKMGLRFPMGSLNQVESGNSMNTGNPDADASLKYLSSKANTIELLGITGERTNHLKADNADSFRGSVLLDKDSTLYIEMVIPVEKIPVRNSEDGVGAAPFTLGIEYGNSKAVADSRESSGKSSSSVSGSERNTRSYNDMKMSSEASGSASQKASSGTGSSKSSVLLWIKNIKLATRK